MTALDISLSESKVPKDNLDVTVLRSLFEHTINGNKSNVNKYIIDTFNCFRLNKSKLKINLVNINGLDDKLLNLILYKGDMIYWSHHADRFSRRDEGDQTNLVRPEIYQIFTNVNTMEIYTTDWEGYSCCTISLMALLSSIKNTKIERIEIKAYEYRYWNEITEEYVYFAKTWLYLLWSASSTDIVEKYKAEKINILFQQKETENRWRDKYDMIIIERM